jgi:hypothetical protein
MSHISDPKRNVSYLYFFLYVILGIIMQVPNNQDVAPRACTATDTASGETIVCNLPGVVQGASAGIFLCVAHAQRDPTAAQKLKVMQLRQRSVVQGAGAGAANSPITGVAVETAPPSIFSFNVAPPGSSPGPIHSFFRVPKVSNAPVGFGDNFDFAGSVTTFPVANAILGGIKYEVAEVQTLLIAALRSDVSVSFPEMSEAPFPYGVPLPVAIFLNHPVGADSVVTLIETIGTMMWREWDGRLPAFLAEFKAAVLPNVRRRQRWRPARTTRAQPPPRRPLPPLPRRYGSPL